jgi:MtrB/PioB family decaheme-associated outer membrane protein
MRPKLKLIAVLVANAFAGSAFAAEGTGLRWTGEVGLGLRYVHEKASDTSKLREYRDLDTDPITFLDVRGDSDTHRFNFFVENITTDDTHFTLLGQQYGAWRFRLYGNELRHRFGAGPGARTPYTGMGTDTLTAVLPNGNVNTWNTFDNSLRRRDIGVMGEWSGYTPWYVRVDANYVDRDGIKVIGGSKGTSPGNGSMEIPAAIDWSTLNYSVEGGYQGPREHFALSWHQSKFKNDNVFQRWSNDFFAPGNPLARDTSVLPSDNDLWRIALNGNIRGLPMGSTLAGRLTYSKVESDVSVLPTILATGATNPLTASSAPIFHGEVNTTTAAVTLNSSPMRRLDTRIFYNYRKKDNDSSLIVFTPTPASTLQCSGGPCDPHLFGYTKHNPGIEAFYRINAQNRLGAGYEYEGTERERLDFPNSQEHKYFGEWRNSTLDWLDTRLRYQYMQRRGGWANHPVADPIDAFVRRYDVSPVNQHQIKLRLDAVPAPLVDVSLDIIFKHNDYKETILGRTKDQRQEYYVTAGYGSADSFRVYAFADFEFVKLDSFHRFGGTAATANPALGFTSATNFNWTADNDDKSYQYGIGATWKQMQRLTWHTNLLFVKTEGEADFAVPGAPPGFVGAGGLLPAWFDRSKRISFNLKGVYQHSRNWTFTGGYAWERYKYSDVGYDNFTYIVPVTPVNASTSYFTGEGAFQPYTANIFYVVGQYKF